MGRILKQVNMSLAESLEIERLEDRMEMLVLSVPTFGGKCDDDCDDVSCDDKGCDDTGCDDVGCSADCDKIG